MYRSISHAILLLFPLFAHAETPAFSKDIEKWEAVAVPPERPMGQRMVWSYAANHSSIVWRVYADNGSPSAEIHDRTRIRQPHQPGFVPKVDKFEGGTAFPVHDGWLVGFNQGEFGGALYWFSENGRRNYKVSDHQVVDFVSLRSGVHATSGLAHLGYSKGAVIRIDRSMGNGQWFAKVVAELPFAPFAVSVLRDDTMLITLSNSLVALDADYTLHTLLFDAPWKLQYPNSSTVSPDQSTLYIGMRQFVGEVDLATNKLRLLVPAMSFLNKLPKAEADRIRRTYGH